MEGQNPPEIAKRLWNIVRIMLRLRKGIISKGKFMSELNTMIKRGKIVRKAIHNIVFHSSSSSSPTPFEYEFSCSNTPAAYFFPFSAKKSKSKNKNQSISLFPGCAFAPETVEDDDRGAIDAIKKVLEMLNFGEEATTSPGFPAVGQLRVTDSPIPLHNDVDEDSHVDERADKFIARFYSELWKQRTMASPVHC